MLAQLGQVLLIQRATQLGHEVFGVLCAAVEREQSVQVGKYSRSQAAPFLLPEREQSRQTLGREHQVRPVFTQLRKNALVVGSRYRVELVHIYADQPPLGCL